MSVDNLSRSVLFEIVDIEGGVEQSFTLVIPPMAWSVREPARVHNEKTFGGSFTDDYGEDNLEIIIAGHSGTDRAFPTYSTQNNKVPGIQLYVSWIVKQERYLMVEMLFLRLEIRS